MVGNYDTPPDLPSLLDRFEKAKEDLGAKTREIEDNELLIADLNNKLLAAQAIQADHDAGVNWVIMRAEEAYRKRDEAKEQAVLATHRASELSARVESLTTENRRLQKDLDIARRRADLADSRARDAGSPATRDGR